MDTWKVGDTELRSRLILGSGKFKDFGVMREAIRVSGAEVVTVAIRRVEAKNARPRGAFGGPRGGAPPPQHRRGQKPPRRP